MFHTTDYRPPEVHLDIPEYCLGRKWKALLFQEKLPLESLWYLEVRRTLVLSCLLFQWNELSWRPSVGDVGEFDFDERLISHTCHRKLQGQERLLCSRRRRFGTSRLRPAKDTCLHHHQSLPSFPMQIVISNRAAMTLYSVTRVDNTARQGLVVLLCDVRLNKLRSINIVEIRLARSPAGPVNMKSLIKNRDLLARNKTQ